MKNFKFWGLALLTTALIFAVFYGMITQIDERLQARYPETTETETETIAFETIAEETTHEEVVEEVTTEAVVETSTEIQPTVQTVAEVTDTDVAEWSMVETEAVPFTVCNDSDLMLIAKLIQSEAGYDFCTDEHQRAVASVLLNHVASPSPDFPDTVYGCIFSGWVDNGIKHYGIGSYAEFMSIVPSERAIANAAYVMQYGSTVGDAIYQAEFIPEGHEVVAVFDYGVGMPTYICR